MSVAVLVSEGQTVVALTALLGVSRMDSAVSSIVSTIVSSVVVVYPVGVSAVVPAVVTIVVSVIVSTIASAVVSSASEQGVETKEPGSWLVFTRRLPLLSSTIAPVGS